jgi:hypothetical protein
MYIIHYSPHRFPLGNMLQHIHPVLGEAHVASNYMPAVAKQWLRKQRPLLVNCSYTQQKNGDIKMRNGVFYAVRFEV